MAEFASKGVAGTGLGLGIAGTALGLLNNGNGNILGGLLGTGYNQQQDKINELMTENTYLKATKYTDEAVTPLRVEVTRLQAENVCLNKQLDLREQIMEGKITNVAQAANAGISQLQCAINCLQNTVSGIASTYVPAAKVTPLPAPNPFPPAPPYGPYWIPVPPMPPVPPPAPPASSTANGTGSTGGTTTGN